MTMPGVNPGTGIGANRNKQMMSLLATLMLNKRLQQTGQVRSSPGSILNSPNGRVTPIRPPAPPVQPVHTLPGGTNTLPITRPDNGQLARLAAMQLGLHAANPGRPRGLGFIQRNRPTPPVGQLPPNPGNTLPIGRNIY